MDNLYIPILTTTLSALTVPYRFNGDILIISPASQSLLEVLPGEMVRVEDHTELHLNTKDFNLPGWIAQKVTQLTQTV